MVGQVEGKNINLNPDSPAPVLYNTSYPSTNAIFVNKYSKNGDFIFGNFYLGGRGTAKITTDSQNDIILTGNYLNYGGYNTDFDLSGQDYFLTGSNGASFILKIKKDGNFKWAKYVAGHNWARIHGIKTDSRDNIIFMGYNEAYFNFNGQYTTPNITINSEDYIAKIDTNGNFIWMQQLGGFNSNSYISDSLPFEIDTDNSIVLTTTKINLPVSFPNKNLFIDNKSYRGLLIKIDENRNYLWHATIANTDHSQSHHPLTVSINSDHTVNWTTTGQGVYNIYDKNENPEQIKGRIHYYNYSSSAFSFLMKFTRAGKLIYNKYKMTAHSISRVDKTNNKLYYAGRYPGPDRNPDQSIIDPPIIYDGNIQWGDTSVQKLDKCYSGTPDGDPFAYFCISEQKKIKDLHPKTSYSTWYDSPTSTTPLSPDTVLETKKYYASTQDISCPFNPTRLEVDVRVFQNPPALVVSDFSFCKLQGKRLYDLKINNNQNVEFFDENLNPINLGTNLEGNKKYYVRQIKSYDSYVSCKSDLTSFFVYDTSVPPFANDSQTFCKINTPKISDIKITGTGIKWYDAAGNPLNVNTLLSDRTKYFASQTMNGCESAKTGITVSINDSLPPTGNTQQDFCSAQNPKLSNLIVNGQDIIWYDLSGAVLATSTLLSDGKTYYATQTLSGCESTQKLAVKVNVANGGIPADDYSATFCNDTTANSRTINLNDYKTNLVSNTSDYVFEFFDAANQTISNHSNVTLNIGSNIFNVKISNALGCFVYAKLTLTLNPKPILNLPETAEFCEGKSIDINAGSGFSSYEWTKDSNPNIISTKQILSVSEVGKYTVKVKNASGCENTGSVSVTKSSFGTVIGVQIVNNTATVIMSNPGDFIFSLDNSIWQSANIFNNLPNGNHTVFVKTPAGCVIGQMNFTIFNVSNSFTPNADGINDTWKIDGIENYPNSEIKVYDRNGNMVLSKLTNGSFEWDGKYNSRPLPTGNYWYIIKVSDGRIMNGWLLIKNRN